MVLHIDKGTAAGVHVGQAGAILDGPSGANALEGGAFGYTKPAGADQLLDTYEEMVEALMQPGPVVGFCYTQLTDIEEEQNGLLTFDRRPKVDPSVLRRFTETPKRRTGKRVAQ